jgi:hypothetical protein
MAGVDYAAVPQNTSDRSYRAEDNSIKEKPINVEETIMTKCFRNVVVALILGGCAVHPLPEQVTGQSTLAIVTAIRCEARHAILEHAASSAFDKGAIGFVFDFNITEHNTANLNLGFNQTLPKSTFNLNLAPNSALTRTAERRFTMVDTFLELKKANCSQEALQSRFHYPIAGAIGLDEIIRTAVGIDSLGTLEGFGVDGPTTVGGQAAVFSDHLTYITKFDTGNIAPALTLTPVTTAFALASASLTLQSDRQDQHELTLAIGLPEPPKSTPKAAVRAAARTVPIEQGMILGARGIPSKVLIHSTADPKVRVLWELDRRALLDQDQRLIDALAVR